MATTIKKERDIARAFELGIRLFSAIAPPKSKRSHGRDRRPRVCRILYDCGGAEWTLSRSSARSGRWR